MTGYHSHTLMVTWYRKQEIDLWCEQHAGGNWYSITYDPQYGAVPPTWFFASERDLALFLLRWA